MLGKCHFLCMSSEVITIKYSTSPVAKKNLQECKKISGSLGSENHKWDKMAL